MSARDTRSIWEQSLPATMARAPLVLRLLVMAIAVGLSTSVDTVVVSDGSWRRPFCSWRKRCEWTERTQAICAQKLCEASGFVGGRFNSASGDMCTTRYVSGWRRYWLVDRRRYFYGRAKREAQINATCFDDLAQLPTTTSAAALDSTSMADFDDDDGDADHNSHNVVLLSGVPGRHRGGGTS
mmetsp:Transcript_110071/g.318213  ORF Transcript_110071/g.318213 Transcript_110071/m.318213 type:complete len:183 (+) Transcript_110071:15-563(+)